MADDVTVSVCIPTYNRKDYLLEALDSVFAQGYSDLEVIIVDDGSSDGTSEMVSGLDRTVRYHYQSNAGLAAARNKLIDLAHGKYISFLDSDDLLMPGALEALVLAADGRDDVCVYGDYIRIDENGVRLPTRPKYRPSGRILPQLFSSIVVDSCGNLFPRKVLVETGGFNVHLKRTPDYIKYLQLASKYEFMGLNIPTFMRRRHAENMSQARSKAVLEEFNLLVDFYFNQGGCESIPYAIAACRLAKDAYRIAKLARQEGADRGFVLEYLKRSLCFKKSPKVLFFFAKVLVGV